MAIEKQRLEQEKEKEAAARKERQEQMDTLRQRSKSTRLNSSHI